MDTTYLAKDRPVTLLVDGKGPYIVTKLSVTEGISSSCHLAVTLVCDDLVPEKSLGKNLSISVESATDSRKFLAVVSSIELLEYSEEKALYYYQLEAIDPLSLLAYRSGRKIYQSMSTKQIIESVLSDSTLKSYFKLSMSGSGTTHEYCTQAGETDLNFVQRLMSFEGWHYHLDHSGSTPIVLVADSNQAFTSIDNDTLTYRTPVPEPSREIGRWKQKAVVGTTKLSLGDHTQDLAEAISSGDRKSTSSSTLTALSQYIYGQGFGDKGDIRDAAKRQMERLDAKKLQCEAESHIAALSAGSTFKLTKHPVSACNQEYLVTAITHQVESGESGRNVQYENRFACIPSSATFRPAFIDKPLIHSIQTATVTGPSGEEIYKDKDGRIKVQFHWDIDGKNDENTSCWLPVVQGAASNGFGIQFIPRIGDEVLVSYIEGDPDRPVVSGSIYNSQNKAPYSAATQSGIKTRSTPKGSSKNGNELRFEDQKDKEQVFLHAEKDLMVEINNDNTRTVTGKETVTVEKTIDMTSKEAFSASTDDAFNAKSKSDMSLSSDKNVKIDAGSNADLSASSTISVDGQTVNISGKTKIALSVGACKIEISSSGIKLDAPQISINGSAKAEIKAAMVSMEGSGKTDIKGAIVSVNGSAMTEIKAGAMVQIQGAIAKVN